MSKVTSAKTKGHLTKQELKQDKLVKAAFQVEHFYFTHQKVVLAVAIAILVVIAGVIVARKSMESGRVASAFDMTMAKASFGQGNLTEAQDAFQKIVSSKSGATAAEAKYFLGRIAYEQGNYSQAIDEFNNYLKNHAGNDEIDASALGGLAAAYEATDKPDDAAKTYERIASEHPKNVFAPHALWEAARIYQKLDQKENAIKALKSIRQLYSESAVAAQAKRQLETLN